MTGLACLARAREMLDQAMRFFLIIHPVANHAFHAQLYDTKGLIDEGQNRPFWFVSQAAESETPGSIGSCRILAILLLSE
jgi:hypothetical protein